MIGISREPTTMNPFFESQSASHSSKFINLDRTAHFPQITDVASIPLKQIDNRDLNNLKKMNSQKNNLDRNKFGENEKIEASSKSNISNGHSSPVKSLEYGIVHSASMTKLGISTMELPTLEKNENVEYNARYPVHGNSSVLHHQNVTSVAGDPLQGSAERYFERPGSARKRDGFVDESAQNKISFAFQKSALNLRKRYDLKEAGNLIKAVCSNCGHCDSEGEISTSQNAKYGRTGACYLVESRQNNGISPCNSSENTKNLNNQRINDIDDSLGKKQSEDNGLHCNKANFIKEDRTVRLSEGSYRAEKKAEKSQYGYSSASRKQIEQESSMKTNNSSNSAINSPTRRGSKVKYTPFKHSISSQTPFYGKMHATMSRSFGLHNFDEKPNVKRPKTENEGIGNSPAQAQNPRNIHERCHNLHSRQHLFPKTTKSSPSSGAQDTAANHSSQLGKHSGNATTKEGKNNSQEKCSDPECNTLTLYVPSNERVPCRSDPEVLMKESYMPPSEMLKCLMLRPDQSVDIVLEEIPSDRLKLLLSKISYRNKKGSGFGGVNTRENFVREVKDVLNRIALVDDKRLEDKSVRQMIKLAEEYLARYNNEVQGVQNEPNLERNRESWKNCKERNDMTERHPRGGREEDERRQKEILAALSDGCLPTENGYVYAFTDGNNLQRDADLRMTLQSQTDETKVGGELEQKNSEDDLGRTKKLDVRGNRRNLSDITSAVFDDVILQNKEGSNLTGKGSALEEPENQRRELDKRHCRKRSHSDAAEWTVSCSVEFNNTDSLTLAGSSDVCNMSKENNNGSSKDKNFKAEEHPVGKYAKDEVDKETAEQKDVQNEREIEAKEEASDVIAVKPREISSQDKIFIADALLSLGECKPSTMQISAILESFRTEISEFSWTESSRFYRNLFYNLMQEEKILKKNANKDKLQLFRKEKQRQFARRIERTVGMKKADIDLKFSFEMNIMNQHFRQELWMRVQKCICGKVGQLSCCSLCKVVFYCGKRCQVMDSNEHATICNRKVK